MKYITAVILLAITGTASAKGPEAVAIGGGKYMMTDRNFTIFGSADGIITKLITRAHGFCESKTGGEAELLDSDGADAVPGEFQNGNLRRAAKGASGTIYFKCANSSSLANIKPMSGGRYFQIKENGGVTIQMALSNADDCKGLTAEGSSPNGACSADSASDSLPFRAILEDPADGELIVVEAVGAISCESVVSGIASSSGLSTVKACASK